MCQLRNDSTTWWKIILHFTFVHFQIKNQLEDLVYCWTFVFKQCIIMLQAICQDSTSCGHSSRFVCLYVRTVCQVGVSITTFFILELVATMQRYVILNHEIFLLIDWTQWNVAKFSSSKKINPYEMPSKMYLFFFFNSSSFPFLLCPMIMF
jgi:hypothetical protein